MWRGLIVISTESTLITFNDQVERSEPKFAVWVRGTRFLIGRDPQSPVCWLAGPQFLALHYCRRRQCTAVMGIPSPFGILKPTCVPGEIHGSPCGGPRPLITGRSRGKGRLVARHVFGPRICPRQTLLRLSYIPRGAAGSYTNVSSELSHLNGQCLGSQRGSCRCATRGFSSPSSLRCRRRTCHD